jgi:iron complex outermembrane receptor protein
VWRFQYGFQRNGRREFDMRRSNLLNTPAIDLKLNTHTVEVEWEDSKIDKRTTCVGMTGMMQDNNNVFGTKVIPFIPNFTNQSAGVFLINKYYFQRWTVDVGARYDYKHYSVSGRDYNNRLYHATMSFQNPSLTTGVTLQMPKNQSLNINVSSAWRPPHVAELFSMGTHQGVATIEYGLLLSDSNEVRNIRDVGVKSEQALKMVTTYTRVWEHLQIEVGAYVNTIFNYIYLRPTGITQDLRGTFPYARYKQTDALFIGSDLSAIWKATTHITVTPKVSLLRARDVRHDDYLLYIPSNRYEVAMRYDALSRFWLKGFFVETKVKYVDRQRRQPRVIPPDMILAADAQHVDLFRDDNRNFDFMAAPAGYALVNLATGFSYTGGRARYDFRLSAENVLNNAYREYTNRFRYYADELGRNFIFSIHCVF